MALVIVPLPLGPWPPKMSNGTQLGSPGCCASVPHFHVPSDAWYAGPSASCSFCESKALLRRCSARLMPYATVASQLNRRSGSVLKWPSKPPDTYHVFTVCSNVRGPASIGRRATTNGLVLASNVKPNGLYGLVLSMLIVSRRLPLPPSGPMNSGSGAAWFTDWRLVNDAMPRT